MKKYWFVLAFALAACSGSGSEESEQLKQEVENLKKEIQIKDEIAEEMGKIGTLLDSIESGESNISLSLEKGTSYSSYKERIERINNDLKKAQENVGELESKLKKAQGKNAAFKKQIEELRKQLTEKEASIQNLTAQVEQMKEENAALIKVVDTQKGEIAVRDSDIAKKRAELQALEANLQKLMAEAKKAQADANFERAETYVEMSTRTKFAPKKKKETLQQAYDFYKKAFEGGRQDAYAKMQELEKDLK